MSYSRLSRSMYSPVHAAVGALAQFFAQQERVPKAALLSQMRKGVAGIQLSGRRQQRVTHHRWGPGGSGRGRV